jgi:signal-transduction protein with cAMP-binding, CBS, and nucleotidyltransferase domain
MAARVGPLLAASGYPVEYRPSCGGLYWYASLDEWQAALAAMFAAGDERCAGLADLRWVAGSSVLGQTAITNVRSGLARWRQSALFSQAARQASNLRVALGFFGGLKVEKVGEHRGAINIDSQALYPLVANIRFMAIAYGVTATDTAARLRELVRLGKLNVDPAGRIIEAYHHLQSWKLSTVQSADAISGADRYIWPERLTVPEQESLKECLDAVAGLERLVVQQLVGMG